MSKTFILICKHCGKEFPSPNKSRKYCSEECKVNDREEAVCAVCGKTFKKKLKSQNTCSRECHKILHAKQTSDWLQNKHKEKKGIEGYDFVTCKICGAHLTAFNDKHFSMHNITKEEYEQQYGKITQWTAQKYINEHFMKENNPNSSTKVDAQIRKERSPYSKEFYKARGLDDTVREHFMEGITRVLTSQLQYYINKGYDLDTAREMLHERQSTFSLEKCISKYGEKEGIKRWKERNKKWMEKLKSKPDYGDIITRRTRYTGFSEISQCLFDQIHKKLAERGFDLDEFYATHKHEYYLREGDRCYLIDYTIPGIKYAIEYNGENVHVNKDVLTSEEYSNWRHAYMKEGPDKTWEHDEIKYDTIRDHGYTLKIIWHKEYVKNPIGIAADCVSEIMKMFKEKYPERVDEFGNILQNDNIEK